jgi:hypothetical protein
VSPTSSQASCLGTVGETGCGPAVIVVYRSYLFMNQANFQVSHNYVGVSFESYHGWVPETSISGGPLGHFVFETGTSLLGEYKPHSSLAAGSIPSYCRPIHEHSAARIHESLGTFFECSNSSADPNAILTIQGHDLLQWKQNGMVNQVSFHGHSHENLDLDLAVARSVELIHPSR